jgi:Pentapeptide repeats (8 copies)
VNKIFKNKKNISPIKKIITSIVSLIFLIFCIWVIPVLIANSYAIADYNNAYREFVYKYRVLVLQSIGGIAILIGLYLTFIRIRNSEEQTNILQKNQYLELFSKAVDQLASQKSEIKIAGLYLLSELSYNDHYTEKVLRIISTYLSNNTWSTTRLMRPNELDNIETYKDSLLDYTNTKEFHHITKAFNMLLSISHKNSSVNPIDLRKIIITGYFNGGGLKGVNFNNSIFFNLFFKNIQFELSHLNSCSFFECIFENCDFKSINLRESKFYGGQFINCNFFNGDMSASFNYVHFVKIKLHEVVNLNGTSFKECSLFEWEGYERFICLASFDDKCTLEEGIKMFLDENCHQKNESIEIDKLK